MNAENFVAHNYLWVVALVTSNSLLAIIAARNYRNVKRQLKEKNIENKNLSSLVKEYQSDQNMALEHLTAAKDRKLKSAQIAHAKWREDLTAKHAKYIEDIKAEHAEELKLIREQLQEIKDVKWASAAAMADMDKKHRAATASSIAAVEKKHQDALEERHYQFESKRAQYANVSKMIEHYRWDSQVRVDSIYPVLNDFQRNYIRALNLGNKKNADMAIKVANKRIEKIWIDEQAAQLKVREELSTILLIASEAGVQKIEEMIDCYEKYLLIFGSLMINFIPNLLAQKTDIISETERSLKAAEGVVDAAYYEFHNLLREEVAEA